MLTLLGALLWVGQGFLPPVSSGTSSTSTTLDLARISLAGTAGALLPRGLGVAVLVVPACAVALLALAPWTSAPVRRLRAVVALAGSLAVLAQVFLVLDGEWSHIGAGALCALTGAVLALLGAALTLYPVQPTRSPRARPGTAHHGTDPITHVQRGSSAPRHEHEHHATALEGAHGPGRGEP